jgi:GAF domain-containing protein
MRRLQQAAAALSRALDEEEITRELGEGARAILGGTAVFVVLPDLEGQTARLLYGGRNESEVARRVAPVGNGAIALTARSGEWLEVHDPEASALVAEDAAVFGGTGELSGSLVVGPVVHGRRLLAVLAVAGIPRDSLDGDSSDAVKMLASQAAMALSHALLFEESERERREIEAMADAARAVGASLRMGEVVRLVLRHATRLLRADGGCVAIREGNYLHVVAAIGAAELMAGVHLPLQGSISGRAVNENTAVIVNDVASDPSSYRPALRFAAIEKAIVVPLSAARGPIGALSVFNRDVDFGVADARVLQRLADQVAVAIVNARLFEEVTEATRAWTATFDAIGVGLAIVDDAGRIVRYNSRARQLALGPVPGELAGLPFYEVMLGGAPMPNDERPLERALREGVMVRGTFEIAGTARRLQLTAAPHLDRGTIVTFDWLPERADAAPA